MCYADFAEPRERQKAEVNECKKRLKVDAGVGFIKGLFPQKVGGNSDLLT